MKEIISSAQGNERQTTRNADRQDTDRVVTTPQCPTVKNDYMFKKKIPNVLSMTIQFHLYANIWKNNN